MPTQGLRNSLFVSLPSGTPLPSPTCFWYHETVMQLWVPLTLPPSLPSCPRTWGAWGCMLAGPAGKPWWLPWWQEGQTRATVQAAREQCYHHPVFFWQTVYLVEHNAYLDPWLSRNYIRSTPTQSLQHLNMGTMKDILVKKVWHTMALSASIWSPPRPLGWPASTLPRCRATSTRSGDKAIDNFSSYFW